MFAQFDGKRGGREGLGKKASLEIVRGQSVSTKEEGKEESFVLGIVHLNPRWGVQRGGKGEKETRVKSGTQQKEASLRYEGRSGQHE